ncbi:MAG: arginine repressor [bacterium]
MPAQARRAAIRKILLSTTIRSQSELAALLEAQGIVTTQPMLSRDLRQLQVAKREGCYHLLTEERVTPLEALPTLLRSARYAGSNLIVVHCEPGAASAVARALEAEEIEGLIGTVAGDDSIFVAVDSKTSGGRVLDRVATTLEGYE